MSENSSVIGDRVLNGIIRHPVLVLVATLAFLVGASAQLVDFETGEPKISMDPSIDGILPRGDESRAYYEKIKDLFGNSETILVALRDESVFTRTNLEALKRISEEIESLDEVASVKSLSLALNIRNEDGALRIESFYEDAPDTAEGLADLERRALADPIYAGNLVSLDGRVTVVLVDLLDLPEQELIASMIDERVEAVARAGWPGTDVWLTGGAHVKAEMSRVMLRDAAVVLPISYLVMAAIAFLSFRTLRGFLIPFATTLVSVAATMAFIANRFGNLNQVTVAAPPILMVVGFAYSIHILSAYSDAVQHSLSDPDSVDHPAARALREIAVPTLFTGLTTAAGFLSLASSRLEAIREFAIATSVGVLVAMAFTLTCSAAILRLLPIPKRLKRKRSGGGLDAFFAWLAQWDIDHRGLILWCSVGIAVIGTVGISRIDVGTDLVSSFQDDNPARLDFQRVNTHLEGANAFNIVFETSVKNGFKDPDNLAQIEDLQEWLGEQPDVGGSTSFVDYIKVIHQGINGGEPRDFILPKSAELVSQLLILGSNDELHQYVDTDFQIANIIVRTTAMDSSAVMDLTRRIERRLEAVPPHLTTQITGNSVLVSRTMDDIAVGQAISIATAFFTIYCILVILFTSFRTGLIALIPNALPVLVYFGILGWSGVQLNTSTAIVACVVLGIAVDDTIHLLAHFNRTAKLRADTEAGIVDALRSVGRPITYTTLALCMGFLCMLASNMRSQVEFGWLAAVTLGVAWVIDVTLTPALAARLPIVTIWDVLTLDLGKEPQNSIPLFSGLRPTQARIAALMAQIRSMPAGASLFRNGEAGDDFYVVIDGELSASVESGGREVSLRQLQRGDVIGEAALFLGVRTADVTTVTPVRLLRIDRRDLERIEKRHPRIGARLYANLAHILAHRMAQLTERV